MYKRLYIYTIYKTNKMDITKVTNIEFEDIDHSDYPDYCDAFICNADSDGRSVSEEQLDELNEDTEFVYEELIDYLF